MHARDVIAILNGYRERRKPIAFDLEGQCNWITCYSIADSPFNSVVIPFIHVDGTSVWGEEDEVAIWEATEQLLSDPSVPKILQNSLYDCFVLAWTYGILIRGLQDDTMLKHFELACEQEKSLGFQVSIYTKEPFYKFERKHDDEKVQLEYCAKDSMLTFECNEAQEKQLQPQQRKHYKFNLQLLAPLLFMELRGIKYNYEKAKERLKAVTKRIHALTDRINREAARSGQRPGLAAFSAALQHPGVCGGETSSDNVVALLPLLTAAFCRARRTEPRNIAIKTWQPMRWNGKKWVKGGKRLPTPNRDGGDQDLASEEPPNERWRKAWPRGQWLKPHVKIVTRNVAVEVATLEDVRRFAKDSCKDACKRAITIVSGAQHCGGGWLPAQRGELATLLGLSVKINATNEGGDAQWFLYTHCGLPRQFQKDGNKLTDRLASDDEAVIKAWVKTRDRRAIWFLTLRRLLTSTKALQAAPDADGRIRCAYNLVGTETHRLTCYGSPTGSSDLNLQTVTKDIRDLFTADEDCWMCQRDLSGADGFTVAAYCAMLGDTTMLDDYGAKLKPAQILVLMLDRGAEVNMLTRDALKPLCKPITDEADWRYFAMKRVQHGGSYMMWINTMSNQILTDSYKKTGRPIYVEPSRCRTMLERCLFVRYPGIPRLHAWMEREIKERGALTASNGFTRRFFARKDDKATVKQALAHLPQVYTTYATMLALHRLWTDVDNRREDGSLRVEPLHTVHDSLLTQWRKSDTEWAKGKMHEWFENELLIAQTQLVIPASGTYGPDWKNQSAF